MREGQVAQGVQRRQICRQCPVIRKSSPCSPWKHPGLHTGMSTMNSARSNSQLPLRLLPRLRIFLFSSTSPTLNRAPVRARLARASMIATTLSAKAFVSPSMGSRFC